MPPTRKISLRKLFWSRVRKTTGCWTWDYGVWKGHTWSETDYPYCSDRTFRQRKCSIVAWQLTYGPIPRGLKVCHHCDNRVCVRPNHLFLGTTKQNSEDMMRKGRSLKGRPATHKIYRGSESWNATATERKVRQIRAMKRKRIPIGDMAVVVGLTYDAVRDIAAGKTWRHVA